MKTVVQIIDAARCEFRPDNKKKCGHKHSDSNLRAAFEVKENGDLVFRGYICEKCIQRMSDVPNLSNYSLWPIAEFAAQLARNTLLRDTGNNGGGQGKKRHKGQRRRGQSNTKQQQNKQQANGLRLWPAREKELEEYVEKLFAPTADPVAPQAQA